MRYPMPLNYQNMLEFKKPYVLRNTFKNYRILSTQDYVLQLKQNAVKDKRLKPEAYKKYEKKYLFEIYGFKTKYYDDFYYETRKGKF